MFFLPHMEGMKIQLRYKYNFLSDGSVVTRDGEYLGTWAGDPEGHPMFYPDGTSGVCLFEIGFPLLNDTIDEWLKLGKPDYLLQRAHSTEP
jgi:hypothetical protein